MEILESLSKAYNVFIRDLKTPKSFRDGEKFEEFARDVIFPDFIYKLLEKTHSYLQNKDDFPESSKNPDYKFECTETRRKFYLECKYRNITEEISNIEKISKKVYGNDKHVQANKELDKKFLKELKGSDRIKICEDYQLKRYKEINIKIPVFILLGLFFGINLFDGFRNLRIYLLPIDDIINFQMSIFDLDYYVVPNNHYIIPPRLWENIEENYIEKAFCIRCGNEIKFNNFNPLCYDCWQKWFEYSNYTYKEKFCHKCRKEADVSVARPLCIGCYKELNKIEM